jgi:hypothetical protein
MPIADHRFEVDSMLSGVHVVVLHSDRRVVADELLQQQSELAPVQSCLRQRRTWKAIVRTHGELLRRTCGHNAVWPLPQASQKDGNGNGTDLFVAA